ncbi:MAG: aminoacyl-tRNA hydrolase [Clostridia bacterium]|nr:aminoacyl-tRNA hydrolase [Clostridia bacterium]MDD4048330.1 aminoacyl-tRNA hydrolase [Clostridia bacterium]
MKLIVGLGNPGDEYKKTRHNIGFMVLDALTACYRIDKEKKQCKALLGQGNIEGQKIMIAKPQTYMNNSGEAVLEILNYYKNAFDDFIIIHDDLDMDCGRIRFKRGGGSGGHNGLKSITKMLNSDDYSRLKIGIGRPPKPMKTEDYVLGTFSKEEREYIPDIINAALNGLKMWCSKDIDDVMNEYNGVNIEFKK